MERFSFYFCIFAYASLIILTIFLAIRAKIQIDKEKKKNEKLKEAYKEYETKKNELKEKIHTGNSSTDVANSISILQDLANNRRK